MMGKKWGKAVLFPPVWLSVLLVPAAVWALWCAFARWPETDPRRVAAYVLSAYVLAVWCLKAPAAVRAVQAFRRDNPYMRRWRGDVRLRVTVTLCGAVLWNGAYAALQLGMAVYHRSAWFASLAGYYALLAVMRGSLVRYTWHYRPTEQLLREWRLYRRCGRIFLLMNLALSVMVFYMAYRNRTVQHHEITTIALAAYTFTSLTAAIVNAVRYRRYGSPVVSASKVISLAAACVSMLTLEATMLATFGADSMAPAVRQLFLLLSGGAVSVGVVAMALYMMIKAGKAMKGETNRGTTRNI